MEILGDKLVQYVAYKNNLSIPDAAKLIDACIEKISTDFNTSYNLVYNSFYTFAGLSKCLAGSCSTNDLNKCKEMCHCVIFKNTCMPRYLPNAIEINDDPDKWLLNVKTNDLMNLAEYASYLYYNFDGGGLTDNAFDAIEYHLNKRLKTKGRKWEKIGAEPIEKLKAHLPYPMPSLDKLKPGNPALLTFLETVNSTGMLWSSKLDGVSGMVIYKNGVPDQIFTRGDGTIGGNVSYLKDYIKFTTPSYKYFVVRGEFVLTRNTWETKYKDTGYANARSFVSAKINTGYISPALVDIQFVAYQIVDWSEKNVPPPSQAFKILEQQGFLLPEHGLFEKQPLIFDIISIYKQYRVESIYYIDGLVLTLDTPQPLTELINPAYSKAFKMTLEEQLRNTRVINVDWNITKHGRYFPVAVYESVYIDGIRLHRASAHNAGHVIDWHMGKGTKIIVTRSGDVIPTIKDVVVNENVQPILPDDTFSWHWSENNKDILLDDIENNPQVQIKRILHFFSTIQTPQVGEGRITKLYEAGFTTLQSFTLATQADIQKVNGFGPKLSKTIYDNIHSTMKHTRLDRYFIAITTFKTQIGRSLFKQVVRYYPNILSDSLQELTLHLNKIKIPGVGPKRKIALLTAIPKFKEILLNLNKTDIEYAIKYQEQRIQELQRNGYNSKIKNKIFVMTGFLDHPDYELEDYIWDHWGDVSATITSKTTAVICANIANITGKMIKAHELGISVYTIAEFVKEFNVPIGIKNLPDTIIPENSESD